MNKKGLVESVANKTGKSKKEVEDSLNAFLETIVDTVAQDEKVLLVGFGTFEKRHRKARTGPSPQNKDVLIDIPACNIPGFKAGKSFKERLNA